MNERLENLFEQAFEYARTESDARSNRAVVEKFAELIVGECISTVENAENGYQDYRNKIEDGMRDHCIRLIKNKFGVEE